MTGKNSVPRGWMNFTNLGNQLPGTPFVPFKVPLKPGICSSLPTNRRFTPKDLLEQLPRLKLIINLTNAGLGRYYSFRDFEEQGVQIIQIMCEGQGKLPPPQKLQVFYDAVDDFLRKGKGSEREEIIGVHCTHGLNRTGYFICKYLIEKMNMAPDAAIALFETARGHHIERDQYTTNLRSACEWYGRDADRKASSTSVQMHATNSTSNHSSRSSISYNDRPRFSRQPVNAEVSNWRDRNYHDSSQNFGAYQQEGRTSRGHERRYFQDSYRYRNNSRDYHQERNWERSYDDRYDRRVSPNPCPRDSYRPSSPRRRRDNLTRRLY